MKAIISGASRGIGKAIATALAAEGYELLLLARKTNELEEIKRELSEKNITVNVLSIDLSQKTAFETLKNNHDLLSGTSVIINNVGVFSTQPADMLNINALQQQIDVNLYSAIQLTQAALPYLRQQKQADIVNIGSVMGLQSSPEATDYSISKHALKAWNDGLRERLKKESIKVSAIYPGSVSTSSWDGIDVDREQMIQPRDIANAVVFILKTGMNSLVEEIRISPRDFSI